jgi:hypothetical protein
MGAPSSRIQAADQPSAVGLLTALKTIDVVERQRHADVLSYWLSIRGDKEFPPLHDLDPLEISEAGPSSVLLELISGGHDADIRHLGEALRAEGWPEQIMDAANPSVLSSIAKKLPIVAISRDFLAFEDEYTTLEGTTRCWVTLLPLSGGGAWVDYVYALVTVEKEAPKAGKGAEKPAKKTEAKETAPKPAENAVAENAVAEEPVVEDPVAEATAVEPAREDPAVEEAPEPAPEVAESEPEPVDEESPEPVAKAVPPEPEEAEGHEELELAGEQAEEASKAAPQEFEEPVPVAEDERETFEAVKQAKEPVASAISKAAPGFSKLFDSLAGLTGFYAQGVKVDPVISEDEPVAEAENEKPATVEASPEPKSYEPAERTAAAKKQAEEAAVEHAQEAPAKSTAKQPTRASEGTLQSKLEEVRVKADEARQARLKANAALYEGLSAAYDFALDAEDHAEEYLKLVEAKGLKIQLRSPMTPVVKLAFDGLCDENAIAQLEAVLTWALSEDLPRGSLADRIEAAGGIAHILNGQSAAS